MDAHLWIGALPAFAIAIFNWAYAIFILNRFTGIRDITRSQLLALSLYIAGGYAAWIAEMSILLESKAALQVAAAFYRTFVNWIGVILIVNERLTVTRQQVGSLIFVIIIAMLWEAQHRIVLQDMSDVNCNSTPEAAS